MPHLCDNCERSFPNGSKQMLSGCPECGGTKFQYVSESQTPASNTRDAQGFTPSDDSDIIEADPEIDTQPEDSAQRAARGEIIEPDDGDADYGGSVSDLVSGLQSEYGPEGTETGDEGEDVPEMFEPGDERQVEAVDEGKESGGRVTNVDTLRDELMDQFESINILEPGSYELNLVKLYEREEHIIQIQEDGKYVIQIPER